jgi:predicted nucleic acid-binding protein
LKEPVVVDSTCLIGLEQIGRLDLLPNLFDPIHAPPEVERESGLSASWLKVENPSNPKLISALKVMVDDGEAEAIALAVERNWKIVLDDRRARDVAQRMALKIIGTVGILVRAKREGLVPWIKPLINGLTDKGFHLSEDLKREALRLVGE